MSASLKLVDPFRKTQAQPVKYYEGVGHVVVDIATKSDSEQQTSSAALSAAYMGLYMK